MTDAEEYEKNILETLECLKEKDSAAHYLRIINIIMNLLNEEETDRFLAANFSETYKTDHMTLKVNWNGKVLE